MKQHFQGERLVHPCVKDMSVKLGDGHKMVVRNQTRTLQVVIGTPWGPELISDAFAVIPRNDSLLTLGSKTSREKLGIDVMPFENSKAQGGHRSSGEVPQDVGSSGGMLLQVI